MTFNISEWLNEVGKDQTLFLFKGEVTGHLITNSLDEIEEKLIDVPSRIKKKIYNVLVELLQNLYHHSAIMPANLSKDRNGKYAICMVIKNDNGYHVKSGNFVTPKQKLFLNKHLSHINTLNREELKDLYKDILNNQEFSDKGGGGLGMVDIARKSGSKLNYIFHNYVEDFYFFSFNINIIE